jgi:hypothetical protein
MRPQTMFSRLAASGVLLFAFNLSVAAAADHWRREPTVSHWYHKSGRYTRESNHGLIHYPTATYWASGSYSNSVNRWGYNDMSGYSSYDVAPSPWAYQSIAPYKHQYHPTNGTGYFATDSCDCRN